MTTSPQAVLPKLPYHSRVNVLYLLPLFIALGVILGAITAVILLKWREHRRRLRRTSTLLPGPAYAPPENDVEDRLLVHGYPSMEQVSLFTASTPSKFTVHGSRYIPKRILAWQTHDTARPPYSQPTYTQTIIPSSDGETFTVVTQDDPFLASSGPMVMREFPTLAFPTIRILPSVPELISGDRSNHQKEKDTNPPKPFRRSMFDMLKLRGPHLHEPNVHDQYTVLAPDDETVVKTSVHGFSSLKEASFVGTGLSRSTRSSLDGGFHVGEMEDALGLLAFQDDKRDHVDDPVILPKQNLHLEDGTSPSPTRGEEMRMLRKVTPFAVESTGSLKKAIHAENEPVNMRRDENIEGTHRDIYTKAPQRRRSQTPHKNVSASGASRRSSAPDTHASVLPLSPPSLMSPPLEKSLFFTSPFSSSASLITCMNSFGATDDSPPRHKKKKATKKLRTSQLESPLPYPSYPDCARAQPTPRKGTSTGIKQQNFSPRSPNPKGRSTSMTHRESATGISSLGSLSPTSLAVALASSSSSDMLNKVNGILAQGYTQRRMSLGGGENVGGNLPDSV